MDLYQHEYDFPIDETLKKWRTLNANGKQLLLNEFAGLRKMDKSRTSIAMRPNNRPKNRYKEIYPYDEDFCRVSLSDDGGDANDEDSTYINASIVSNVLPNTTSAASSSHCFYAAQGPTDYTIDDFVRMIVEQQITVIVMLSFTYDSITNTYVQEHAPYFTEKSSGTIETKSFTIRTTTVTPSYRCVGRKLTIKSKSTKVEHKCDQYHYAHFIDQGTPIDCHSITSLVLRLLHPDNRNARILVHCSAGIGRTGVFIALYYLIEAFERRATLNVKQVVDTMRYYRAHLVQTMDQYEFLYRCLVQVAIHPCDGRSLDAFVRHCYHQLPTLHLPDNHIRYDFEHRADRVEDDTFLKVTMARQNAACNQDQQNVPYDHNCVILHPPSDSAYINASFVANIIGPRSTILTQEPIVGTFQPFFTMLLQEHKTFVVAIEQMQSPGYAKRDFISPSDVNTNVLPVKSTKNKFGDYYSSYKIKIKHGNIREAEVFIYEYTGEWTNDETCVPKNLEQFIRFVDRSIHHQNKPEYNRSGLVVHDRLGGSKAAFYCIAQNLFDRLLTDGRVAIENFTSDVCQQRMNALIDLRQYEALHEMVRIWSELQRRGALENSYKKGRTKTHE